MLLSNWVQKSEGEIIKLDQPSLSSLLASVQLLAPSAVNADMLLDEAERLNDGSDL